MGPANLKIWVVRALMDKGCRVHLVEPGAGSCQLPGLSALNIQVILSP